MGRAPRGSGARTSARAREANRRPAAAAAGVIHSSDGGGEQYPSARPVACGPSFDDRHFARMEQLEHHAAPRAVSGSGVPSVAGMPPAANGARRLPVSQAPVLRTPSPYRAAPAAGESPVPPLVLMLQPQCGQSRSAARPWQA
eukprot:NODE_4862_length_634_cov_126.905009.p3 GENE.NODE_4862_length_634_cov_126.905009~~NODE_4862_length_634_cov_126.905009.p3  ORF type:complete len:143 (+),score=22.30 NODE_4862_length_634_cov_126.905009:3-431(+)